MKLNGSNESPSVAARRELSTVDCRLSTARNGALILLVVASLPLLPLLWLAMAIEGARQSYARR